MRRVEKASCQMLNMPKKIRELKVMLRKAGFFCRSAKGSHTIWEHSDLPGSIVLSGGDGEDAKPYQEKDVRAILKKLKEL